MTKSEIRTSSESLVRSPASSFEFWIYLFTRCSSCVCWLFVPALAQAATNSGPEEIPPLRPPRAEMPPGFWEEHGLSVVASGVLLLIVISIAVWFFRRARPGSTVPPDVLARQALEALRAQPENGILLSKVSQVLRRYVITAFGLPPGELTTTEFCEAISGSPSLGAQLSDAISEFLRRCDQRKFALLPDAQPIDAISSALKFVEQAEARRAEICKAEQTSEGVR